MLRIAAAAALSALLLTRAAAAESEFLTRLFGAPPGQGESYACFRATWDAGQLAAHPDRNVTAMTLLAIRHADDPDSLDVRLDGALRSARRVFGGSGTCGSSVERDADGGMTIGCGVECDGGAFSLTAQADGALMVADANAAHDWTPAPAGHADAADGLGPADTRFRLERARLAQCAGLSASDEEQAVLLRDR